MPKGLSTTESPVRSCWRSGRWCQQATAVEDVKGLCKQHSFGPRRLDAALSRLPKAEKGMQALEQILAKAAEDEKDLTEVVLQQADLMETFRFHAEELCDPEIWETVCSLDMKMAARIIELVKLRGKPALQVFKESMKFTSDVVGLLADLEHGPGSPKRSRSPPAAKSASRRSKKRNVLP
ncbi:unnamed protein product [Symbiodinium sp. CCMP2592]|nr:unnamed protein product [Symbiodinium sp. CCMP2592]